MRIGTSCSSTQNLSHPTACAERRALSSDVTICLIPSFNYHLDAAVAAVFKATILLVDAAVAIAFAKVMNSVTSLAKIARSPVVVAPALILA